MKIDHNRGNLDPVAGARADAVRDERAAGVEQSGGPAARTGVERPEDVRASDQVRVSTTSQLAATAAAAANAAPDIRPEAVARGRDLLASGELGRDAERLADKLIDSLLGGS
jgi:flagellar biosynthesis anti-sigma factor FlgM